jgi:nucleotide-binding universal stress UspA family protein
MCNHGRNNRMKPIISHARTNTGLPLAGSCGESLATNRLLDCAQSPGSATKVILVPLTLSNGSYPTLAIAKNHAHESNARLVLLHVVQLNIAGEEHGIPRTCLINELCRNAKIQLQELAGCLGDRTDVEVLVCEGRPAEAIIETARRLEADTIIMHTSGHRGWLKWLHRNTALNVALKAPCKVWLVSPGEHAETVVLTRVDHTSVNQASPSAALPERQKPFHALLQSPFS